MAIWRGVRSGAAVGELRRSENIFSTHSTIAFSGSCSVILFFIIMAWICECVMKTSILGNFLFTTSHGLSHTLPIKIYNQAFAQPRKYTIEKHANYWFKHYLLDQPNTRTIRVQYYHVLLIFSFLMQTINTSKQCYNNIPLPIPIWRLCHTQLHPLGLHASSAGKCGPHYAVPPHSATLYDLLQT